MKVLIIGTGYVGTTTGLVFAELGHTVTGLDVDAVKIDSLRSGKLYFHEPGLDTLLRKHLNHRLHFTTHSEQAISDNDIIFICVGTPGQADGSPNLQFIQQAASDIGRFMNRPKTVVIKSTVPVGTNQKVSNWINQFGQKEIPFQVVSNPEFLREGSALEDALHPDRIVIGSRDKRAANLISTLYQGIHCPMLNTDPETAELTKYAANSFLALKISFMNELARLCDKLDLNILDVAKGIGMDKRIGDNFLQAGIGYGGSCFPKDVKALLHTATRSGVTLSILEQAMQVNDSQPIYFLNSIRHRHTSLSGKTIALLGLSFKPHTDDTRESRSMSLLNALLAESAVVKVHDPVVRLPSELGAYQVSQHHTVEDTVKDADSVILCTEWPQYKNANWAFLKSLMKTPNLFDGRNLLDADYMKSIGFDYQGIGYR